MTSTIALDRLLGRLEHTLSQADSAARLQRSQYERNRVSANIEHARALLIALEKQTSAVRVQSTRAQVQDELQRRRAVVNNLTKRLRAMNAAALEVGSSDDDTDNEQDEDDERDVLNAYAPARPDMVSGIDSQPDQSPSSQQQSESQQDLRARRPLQAKDNHSLASTSAREQLFAGRVPPSATSANATGTSDLQHTETLMSHNRIEQESLATGLLALARALKESSQSFAASLESEKDVLNRAQSGLDKNAQGMEAAERKMSLLRRMSEGQGLWGRIKLYGFIAAMWFGCFLFVFIVPKLRF